MDEEQRRKVTIGGLKPLKGPVQLVEYNADWPSLFLRQAEKIRLALGDRVLHLAHVGSTSVPGLARTPRGDRPIILSRSRHDALARSFLTVKVEDHHRSDRPASSQ